MVTFKHISISNFCGIKDFDTDLYNKTIIKGYNRQGKSTIINAILWVLTGKLSDNSDAGDSIRPHDDNGIPTDYIDATVSVTVESDGEEYVITKTQRQKWVTKRGSSEKKFEGNENIYEISGVPKKAKDFEQFINDNICPIGDLPFCENANAFLSLDTNKKREKLFGISKSVTDEDVIASDPDFEQLRSDLKVGTPDELVKRTKQTISALKKSQQELPVRIDEVRNSIVEYDFSALELQKNAIKEQMANIDKAAENKASLLKAIGEREKDLVDIENVLTSASREKRHEMEMTLLKVNSNIQDIIHDIRRYEEDRVRERTSITNNEIAIKETQIAIDTALSRDFGENSLVCDKCGQLLPIERQEAARAEFEANKAAEIARHTEYLETLETNKTNAESKIKAIEEKIETLTVSRNEESKKIDELKKEIDSFVGVDFKADAEYKAKEAEIARLKNQYDNLPVPEDKSALMAQLEDIEHKLSQSEVNAKAEERAAELTEEMKAVGQNVLNAEKQLDTIERFIRKKIEMMEDSVNQYFEIIKWRFFVPQINGGYQSVCRATVNGTDYDTLLNKSDKILCRTDLCLGFQKAAGVNLPIMLDDCESIDSDRLPNTDHQQILLRRDDCKLTVEGA